MAEADHIVFWTAHTVLIVAFFGAFFSDRLFEIRKPRIKLEALRGELTMNAIYFLYGVATIVFSMAIDFVDLEDGKVSLLFADYLMLSYLFFLSRSARNGFVMQALSRISRD